MLNLNGWWPKGFLIGCVVAMFSCIVADILGRILDTRAECFVFLLPMIMVYSVPVLYKIGVKYVITKEGLEPILCDRIKKEIGRLFYYQIAFSLIFISLSIGVFFCSQTCSYAVFRVMSGLLSTGVGSFIMFFAITLPHWYERGIEDMQKVIAERRDGQVNAV